MKYSEKAKLNFFLVVSVIIIVLNNIVLNDIPEIFNRGYEIGQVLSNLSLSFIASYIFYLVVVVAKDKRDKQNVLSIVYALTRQLVGRAYSIYDNIAEAAGKANDTEGRHTVSSEEFLDLCLKGNPKDISPSRRLSINGAIREANFGELIVSNAFDNVKALHRDVLTFQPYLDSEQVQLMSEMLNSSFFIMAPSLADPHVTNENFSSYGAAAYAFIECTRRLDTYNEKHNRPYFKAAR